MMMPITIFLPTNPKLLLKLLLLSLLCHATSIHAQNLVANPGLETFADNKIPHWSMVAGTTDIASLQNQISFPANVGTFNPYLTHMKDRSLDSIRFGQICFCQGFNSDWSEVTEVALTQPLQKNKKYHVSLYVKKVDGHQAAISEVPVMLTKKPLPRKELPFLYSGDYASLKNTSKTFIRAEDGWQQVSATYVASGRERFLSIGNFDGANQSVLSGITGAGNNLYYCFDQVAVIPWDGVVIEESGESSHLEDLPLVIEEQTKTVVPVKAVTKSLVIEHSYFAFDKAGLSAKAHAYFEELITSLDTLQLQSVNIIGHTDNIGEPAYNMELSRRRAMSVRDKLIALGVPEERLYTSWRGDQAPVAGNETTAGRLKNRRVELTIVHLVPK
ncbi:MAG: OmpA family protein [Bacteroidota bacterium]